MIRRYILNDNGSPVAEPDMEKWNQWCMQGGIRQIAEDCFEMDGAEVRVSTIFLAADHSFGGPPLPFGGPPILWETMVFGGKMDLEQERCTGNREQAEAMHAQMLAKVRNGIPTP